MDLVIRTDASELIGSGHVMRCLTLAEKVRLSGGNVTFICRELPGNRCDYIESRQFKLYRLPYENMSESKSENLAHSGWLTVTQDKDANQSLAAIINHISTKPNGYKPDWLLVDHYAIDYDWEVQLRESVSNIMIIDDLADRRHNCDLLLDQNFQKSMNQRYVDLLPDNCRILLGPSYALLRSEFEFAKKNLTSRDGSIKRILVFMGGYDLSNETGKVLKALLSLNLDDCIIDIVIGAKNSHKEELKAICQSHKHVNYHCQIENIATLMSFADLAIGGGGTTTWERAYLGLPSIVITLAQNQEEFTKAVAEQGSIINLGWYHDVTEDIIAKTVRSLMVDKQSMVLMSQQAEALFGEQQVSGVDAVLNEMISINQNNLGSLGDRKSKGICK